jgi:hypothetical protein
MYKLFLFSDGSRKLEVCARSQIEALEILDSYRRNGHKIGHVLELLSVYYPTDYYDDK